MITGQKNIEKARELYLKRGVLKRELLRDEVVYSWVRSRLVNVDALTPPNVSLPEKSDLSYRKIMDALFLHDFGLEVSESKIKSIILMDMNGEIHNVWTLSPKNRYYFNFTEDSLGTSGIGLCLKHKKKSFTCGYEHYHSYLIDSLSIGIPTSDGLVIGLICEMDSDFEKDLQLISRLPESIENIESIIASVEANEDQVVNEIEMEYWPACLIGDSEEIKKARDRVQQFKDSKLIFISGPKGIGKESTANHLHEIRLGKDMNFHAIYCDKIPLQKFKTEWLEDSDKIRRNLELYDIGTVYFENFNALPDKYQRRFLRILDSKLVNSNAENGWNNLNTAFIISTTKGLKSAKQTGELTRGLQSRVKLAEICLPGLTRRKQDICTILGHMITCEIQDSNLLHEIEKTDIFDRVSQLGLEYNLRDLDYICQKIVDRVFLYGTLTESCIDEILQPYSIQGDEQSQLKSLSEIEKEAIVRTLEALNYNMVQTSLSLGISRSTLYRKIEHYNISFEAVRE